MWINVSSRSKTSVYVLFLTESSNGGKNGGYTLGKLAKLLGKVALVGEAIADAFRIVKGFLPVTELPPAPEDTRLVLPLVLVELVMPILLGVVFSELGLVFMVEGVL